MILECAADPQGGPELAPCVHSLCVTPAPPRVCGDLSHHCHRLLGRGSHAASASFGSGWCMSLPSVWLINPLPRVFVSVCPHIRWRWRCSSSPQLYVRSASCCQLVCVCECAPRISRRCATCPSSQASSASSTAAACFPLVTTARRCMLLWVVPLGSCPARIAMEGAPRWRLLLLLCPNPLLLAQLPSLELPSLVPHRLCQATWILQCLAVPRC